MLSPQKKAYILILVGMLVPLLLIPFLSGYKAGGGWFSNLMNLKIAFGHAFGIPYRFVLGIAIFLIFVGVRQLDLMKH